MEGPIKVIRLSVIDQQPINVPSQQRPADLE